MRRREFVALFAGAAALWPQGARSQQVPVIGFLSSATRSLEFTPQELADRRRRFGDGPLRPGAVPPSFRIGLNESGYVPGQNVTIEVHAAGGDYDQLPALAADLVRRKVNLIVSAGGLVSAQAARAATTTIPILFIAGTDPIRIGLVDSLSRPGGNATGVSVYFTELLAKRLELLRELVPGVRRVALLVNPNDFGTSIHVADMEAVTAAAGLKLAVHYVSAESEFEAAFAAAVRDPDRADALLVSADPFFTTRRNEIVALAARHSLPAIYPWREYAEIGGLMSYGPNIAEAYHEIGLYAGRILKGASPGDLPVQLPKTFELILNLGTATALGLTVPKLLYARVDKVIGNPP